MPGLTQQQGARCIWRADNPGDDAPTAGMRSAGGARCVLQERVGSMLLLYDSVCAVELVDEGWLVVPPPSHVTI